MTAVNTLRIGRMVHRFDAVHLIKTRGVALLRTIRKRSRARVVYDLGDALWLPHHRYAYADIDEILGQSDAVTCDNRYGLDYARKRCKDAYLWPPASQVELFDEARAAGCPARDGSAITLGWIGSPTTAFNLFAIWEALEHLACRFPEVHLRVVGCGPDPSLLPHFERVSYSCLPHYTRAEMIAEVLNMDVGLFPMFDVGDAKVRGILKALVYMSGEAAVVASPRGECVDLIEDGRNGFLAGSKCAWIEKTGRLIESADLRGSMTAEGLKTVRAGYTLEKSFELLRPALRV
jgi:glycosyltransferase involved in cell wall biosynthesis